MEDDVTMDPGEVHNESESKNEEIDDESPVYVGGEPILPARKE